MPNPYGTTESLERARRARWKNKTPEDRRFAVSYANASRWAKIRGDGLERCITIQTALAHLFKEALDEEETDIDTVLAISVHLANWEKLRMIREKMEPQSVQYQPTPEEPTEEPSQTILSGVDQEELERLATSVPAYRGSNQGGHPPTQRPYKQRTLGMVTGVAEQDQRKAARRKEEAQIAATDRPVHEEEE